MTEKKNQLQSVLLLLNVPRSSITETVCVWMNIVAVSESGCVCVCVLGGVKVQWSR